MSNLIYFLSCFILILFFTPAVTFLLCRFVIKLPSPNSTVKAVVVTSIFEAIFIVGFLVFVALS